jgi:hypothetical protein
VKRAKHETFLGRSRVGERRVRRLAVGEDERPRVAQGAVGHQRQSFQVYDTDREAASIRVIVAAADAPRGVVGSSRLPTRGCRVAAEPAARKRARLLLDRIKREKGVWWMPWQQEAMKDVALCDKPGGGESTL